MNNTEIAFCRLCAVCKPHNKLIDLRTNADRGERIVNKLTLLNCELDFNENEMPKTVCLICVNSLTRAFDFVIAVERAQIILRSIVSPESIKKEVDMSDSEPLSYETIEEKYSDNISIKFEEKKEDAISKLPFKKLKDREKDIEDIKDQTNSDSIPLSQLKPTWKDYSWTCSYCETQFPNITELHRHSIEYHKACNAYRCTDCNVKRLCLNRFLTHVRGHRKYSLSSCYRCFKTFPSKYLAHKHKATHIKSQFKCTGCNMSFSTEEELEEHLILYNKNPRSRNIPAQEQKDILSCLKCKKKFKTKTTLNTHLLIHTERKREHTCEVCGKCFWQKQALVGHMMIHEDKRPYHCGICKSSFRTRIQLRQHVSVHGNEKPFSCEQCGRCFRLQKHLNSHGIIHTDSMPHVCSYCNKGFRFKSILNQHLRQHTGVKPYSCDICGRDFTNWPNYNKHMKGRHSMNKAKKKHTPDGLYPIDPATGKVVYPEMDKVVELKSKIMEETKPRKYKMRKPDVLGPEEDLNTEDSSIK